MERSVSGVGVIDKSVLVLDALAAGPLGLNDLADATGIPRATAHRIAVALEAHRLVRRDADGRFALGMRLVALGRAAAEALPLAAIAAEALEDLRDGTRESAQLYVREGDRRVCVAALESPHGLRTIVPTGAVLPLERGSAGLVLAGHKLDRRGWIETAGQREAGVASVSAPVRDGDRIVAAVSVSGPIDRITARPGRLYGARVVRAARRIERDAGLRGG